MDIVIFVLLCLLYIALVSYCNYKCRNERFDNDDYDYDEV